MMSDSQIADRARQIADPARREEFLLTACGGDSALKQRVAALLALEQPAHSVLPNDSTDASDDQTQQIPLPAKAAEQTEDVAEAANLSFLKPSGKAGSIGVLGHYEILRVLGQGAFGIVFLAFDEKLHRHVAIKTMTVQMAATSPPRKRFLREARAAAAVRHDNVTQVYSVEEEPIPYLVMEFIDGPALAQKLNESGPLEVPEMLHLTKQIALGLAAAHAQGLIHRDIKPGNILLEKGVEQKVKITDFGLARAADDASLTQSGLIAGTPLYMAPEQAQGLTLDARTDLFSVGSVLYQMAAGHPPFRAKSTVAVLKRVVDDQQRPLKELIPELPEWFEAIVNKLLAKSPSDRFQSAKELADLLGRCQMELQLHGRVSADTVQLLGSVAADARPEKAIANSAGSSVNRTANPAEGPAAIETVGRSAAAPNSRWATVLTFAALLALLGIVGWRWNQPLSKPTDTDSATMASQDHSASAGSTQIAPETTAVPQVATTAAMTADNAVSPPVAPGGISPPQVPVEPTAIVEPAVADKPVPVLAPLAGSASLVQRPQFIPGLKSWDIVRAMPAGVPVRIERLPDGRFVSAWFNRPGIYVHGPDLRAQQVLLSRMMETNGSNGLAVAPEQGLVADYIRHGGIHVWEIETGRRVHELPNIGFGSSYSLEFSHSGKQLAATANALHVIDITGAERLRWVKIHENNQTQPRSIVWSPDDSQLWLATADKKFAAYHVADLEPVADHPLHDADVCFLTLSPDKSRLLVSETKGEIRVYNVADWTIAQQWTLESAGEVTDAVWSPDQSQIAVATVERVEIWNFADPQRVLSVKSQVLGWRSELVWSADGQRILAAQHHKDATCWINASDGQTELVRWGGAGATYLAAGTGQVSPHGNLVAVDNGKRLALFDTETGRQRQRSSHHGNGGFAFFRNPDLLLASDWERTKLVDIPTNKHSGHVDGLDPVLSPDETQYVVQRKGGTFAIHRTATHELLQEFTVPAEGKMSSSWSPDGTRIAVRVGHGMQPSSLHVWNLTAQTLASRTDLLTTDTSIAPVIRPIWTGLDRILAPFGGQVFDLSASDLNDAKPWPTSTHLVSGLAREPKTGRTLMLDNGRLWLFDDSGQKTLASWNRPISGPLTALTDGRRFASSAHFFYDTPARGFDADTMQDLGCLFPFIGEEGWLTIGPTGHYQGSKGIESEILYVAEHLDGHQKTYTAAEFAKAFGWKNDPDQSTFLKLVETTLVRGTNAALPDTRSLVERFGRALEFSGGDERVEVTLPRFDLSRPWTIETWCQLNHREAAPSRIALKLGPALVMAYHENWEFTSAQLSDQGNGQWGVTLRSPFDHLATHLAAQWTGTELQFFVDGQPAARPPYIWGTEGSEVDLIRMLYRPESSTKLTIGGDNITGRPEVFRGAIAAVRISQGAQYTSPFTPGPLTKNADTVALYDFAQDSGDVLKDVSGNGHDGEIMGATWVQAGEQKPQAAVQRRKALRFDGVDDYVQIPSLRFPGAPFTMEAWLSCRGDIPLGDGEEPIQTAFGWDEKLNWNLIRQPGQAQGMTLAWNLDPKYVKSPHTGSMINGVLYHVAIVVTDSEIRCYRNGKIGHTASLDGPLTPIIPWRRADHFAIGAKLSASKDQNEYGKLSQFFQGDIRSLRLSKSERYTAGVPRAELHADADTIALYDFSQGSGDVLKDVSGNGHDGKIFGATWIDGEGQPVNAEPMP